MSPDARCSGQGVQTKGSHRRQTVDGTSVSATIERIDALGERG